MSSPRRQALRFVGIFLAWVVAYMWLGDTTWALRWLHEPLSRLLAVIITALLSPFGDATRSGEFVQFENFRAQIVDACNGVLPAFLFTAAVLAFPCRWRDRGWGILIGLPAIFVINLARIFSLMLLGAHRPDLVEKVHIDIWQTTVVILAMALWLYWAESTRRRNPIPD